MTTVCSSSRATSSMPQQPATTGCRCRQDLPCRAVPPRSPASSTTGRRRHLLQRWRIEGPHRHPVVGEQRQQRRLRRTRSPPCAASYSVSGDHVIYFGVDAAPPTATPRWASGSSRTRSHLTMRAASPAATSARPTVQEQDDVSDLLVLSDFTKGGKVGSVKVYEWVGDGSGQPWQPRRDPVAERHDRCLTGVWICQRARSRQRVCDREPEAT